MIFEDTPCGHVSFHSLSDKQKKYPVKEKSKSKEKRKDYSQERARKKGLV